MMSTLAIDNGAQIAPDYRVKLAGSDITADISRRLISLSLTDNRGFEADQLDIALNDADGLMQMPRAARC